MLFGDVAACHRPAYVLCAVRTTQNKQYIEQHKIWEECGPCPIFARFSPGISLITEEKARKNLSHCSRRMPVGTMKTEYTEHNIHNNNNTQA